MSIESIIALCSALTVLVGGFVTAKTSVRKSELEGFQQQLSSLRSDLDRKDTEIKRLAAESKSERRARRAIERALRNKQSQIDELAAVIEVLIKQLEALGQTPDGDLSVLERIRDLNDERSARASAAADDESSEESDDEED